MDDQFENDLNSKKNLKLTLEIIKKLDLTKDIPINKRIIDIKPKIIKNKVFFGLINCNTETDHIYYDLYFNGKNITIVKTTSYDDAYGGGYYTNTIVNIKLKTIKKMYTNLIPELK